MQHMLLKNYISFNINHDSPNVQTAHILTYSRPILSEMLVWELSTKTNRIIPLFWNKFAVLLTVGPSQMRLGPDKIAAPQDDALIWIGWFLMCLNMNSYLCGTVSTICDWNVKTCSKTMVFQCFLGPIQWFSLQNWGLFSCKARKILVITLCNKLVMNTSTSLLLRESASL